MVSEKQMNNNAKIIALFYFQYSLLIPFMHFMNSTLLVGTFSFSLVVWYLLKNGFLRIANYKILGLYVLLLFLFFIKALLNQAELVAILYFFLYSFPAICIFLFPFSAEMCVQNMIIIARVAFVMIMWVPFLLGVDYMRFGYGMLPIIAIAYISIVYKKGMNSKKRFMKANLIIDTGILIIGFVEMLVFGARGCTFALILFLGLDRVLINKKKIVRNLLLIIVAIIASMNILTILDIAERFANKVGIYSYSITKFKMQLSGGFEYASSGRGDIYDRAIETIKEYPIFGSKITLDETGGDYAHNVFLQVGIDFGVIAIVILSLFVLFALYTLWSKKTLINEKLILLVLFSSSMGRLMFSSTLWRRPEFWMTVCMVITLNHRSYIGLRKNRGILK